MRPVADAVKEELDCLKMREGPVTGGTGVRLA